MYILCEYALCVGVTVVVATSLFGISVVFLPLQAGVRHLRLLVERTITRARRPTSQSLVLQFLTARWGDHPSNGNIANITR